MDSMRIELLCCLLSHAFMGVSEGQARREERKNHDDHGPENSVLATTSLR
jgi:hypothetical protein